MLSVRPPVKGRLLAVEFLGSSKLYTYFFTAQGEGRFAPLTPALFKGQLYS